MHSAKEMKAPPNKIYDLPDGIEQPWSYAIGGFILNFGSIEFSLIRLAQVISPSDEKRNKAIFKLLSGRVTYVGELLKESEISDELKKKIIESLREVRVQSKLRNVIAHNPFAKGKNRDGGEVSGIMDTRKFSGEGPYEIPLLLLDDVIDGAYKAKELGLRLQRHIQEICAESQNKTMKDNDLSCA